MQRSGEPTEPRKVTEAILTGKRSADGQQAANVSCFLLSLSYYLLVNLKRLLTRQLTKLELMIRLNCQCRVDSHRALTISCAETR